MCFTVVPRASFICRPLPPQAESETAAEQSRAEQKAASETLPGAAVHLQVSLSGACIYLFSTPCFFFFFVSQRAEGRAGAATAACSLPPDCNPLLHLAGITLGFLSKDKPETTAWEGRAFGAMVRWQPQVVASVRPTCHVQPFYGHVKLAICPTGHCLENNVARQEAASMWQ